MASKKPKSVKREAGQTWIVDGNEYVIIGRSALHPEEWVVEWQKGTTCAGDIDSFSESALDVGDELIVNADGSRVEQPKALEQTTHIPCPGCGAMLKLVASVKGE